MMDRLNLQDFILSLAKKHGMSKQEADFFAKEFFLLIEEALETDKYVKVKGLGIFKLVGIERRESIHINTGERIQLPEYTKISFTPDSSLRDIVNKPFAHFETVLLNDNAVLNDTLLEDTEEENEEADDDTTTETTLKDNADVPKTNAEETVEKSFEETIITKEVFEVPAAEVFIEEVISAETIEEIPATEVISEEYFVEKEVVKENGQSNIENAFEEKDSEEEIEHLMEMIPLQKEVQKITTSSSLPIIEQRQKADSKVCGEFAGKKEKPYICFLIGLIIIVLLLCCGALFFFYYPDFFIGNQKEYTRFSLIGDTQQEQPFLADTLAKSDTITETDTVAVAVVMPMEVREEIMPRSPAATSHTAPSVSTVAEASFTVDSVNYNITGTKATHIIQKGETLTKIALRFYGTKALWPYIVKHNQYIIKNPDNVPLGTVIKIPELKKQT